MWINLDEIQLWDSNPNEGHVGAIYASIERFGFRNPIGLNKGNITHNGNHRVKALHELRKAGWQPFGSCIRVADDGVWEVECVDNTDLSESDSVAYGLADNRTARLGRDDAAKLLALLTPLEAEDILAAGYDDESLSELAELLNFEDDKETSDGSLLALLDITIDEPTHVVANGDIWTVGKHTLICCEVITDWLIWKPYLTSSDMLFCPYPGVFVPLGLRAEEYTLIMVQPDTYICGHILDRYTDVNGAQSVSKNN